MKEFLLENRMTIGRTHPFPMKAGSPFADESNRGSIRVFIMQTRPVREIINANAMLPMGKGRAPRERRSSDRFACKLPAVLTADGKDYPVECLDISAGGVRLGSQRPIPLIANQLVTVRIRLGSQTFEDSFAFVRTRVAQWATHIHLWLKTPDPAESCSQSAASV